MTPPDHDQPLDDGPLDDDTLAVNAVVDDEATPEQRRRVARDPELVARVATLREVVAAVAAPIAPPDPDVLAALRQRALDAGPAEAEAEGTEEDDVDLEVAAPPAPVRDLAAARARRTRTLPPLPAVAAVVVVLVLVGLGFLVAGQGAGDEDAATGGAADAEAEAAGGDGGGGGSEEGGEETAASEGSELQEGLDGDASANTTIGGAEDGPSGAAVEDLRERATASYATQDELLAELGVTDPETLALKGRPGEAASTTTGPASPGETADTARLSAELAADPIARRCDDTLRAGEPEAELDAATGAALVEVAGVPVLVLRTPIEPTDRAPLGIRLTALTALDCSPLGAVVR